MELILLVLSSLSLHWTLFDVLSISLSFPEIKFNFALKSIIHNDEKESWKKNPKKTMQFTKKVKPKSHYFFEEKKRIWMQNLIKMEISKGSNSFDNQCLIYWLFFFFFKCFNTISCEQQKLFSKENYKWKKIFKCFVFLFVYFLISFFIFPSA